MAKKRELPEVSKEKVKKIWDEKIGSKGQKLTEGLPFRNYVAASIITNLVLIAVTLLITRWMPPEIPLFYGLPQSNAQLASNWMLFIPSSISLLIIGLNIALAKSIKNEFLIKTLILSSIAVTFFSAITTLKIIFLVVSF